MLQLNFNFWMSWRHFLMKKSKEANWPSGGVHLDLRTWSVSKISLFEALELSSLSWKKAFNWMRRRNFSTSCLTENSSVRFAIGTKFRPLLRTDFSESVSGRFSGIVTTVFWLSNVAWLLILGPIKCSSCTSVHYKATDSHSYLLHSSSHPSHVKNSIPYSQFLRLRRLCSDDSDFSNKSKEMCQFFEKRGYPASVIQAAHHRAQQIDRQSALQTSQKEKNDRIPFTLTFHPRNNPVKAIILNNFKILQNDPETGAIFSQPPLISFKRDKNVGNFLVRSAFKTIEKPGTFKCARSRCKTCPFVQNADKISGPKRSVKITDRFTCTSANVIYCITCTLCKKLFLVFTWRHKNSKI